MFSTERAHTKVCSSYFCRKHEGTSPGFNIFRSTQAVVESNAYENRTRKLKTKVSQPRFIAYTVYTYCVSAIITASYISPVFYICT